MLTLKHDRVHVCPDAWPNRSRVYHNRHHHISVIFANANDNDSNENITNLLTITTTRTKKMMKTKTNLKREKKTIVNINGKKSKTKTKKRKTLQVKWTQNVLIQRLANNCYQSIVLTMDDVYDVRMWLFIRLIYTVSQKTVQNCFCHNFVKFVPTLTIFGTMIAQGINLCDVHLFSTSPNSRQRPTVLNADVPKLLHNAVIMSIRLLTFASSIWQRAPRYIIVSWY